MRLPAVIACAAVVVTSGCSDKSPTAPSSGPRTWTWVGTISDAMHGSGQVTITASGASSVVLGTWVVRFSGRETSGQVIGDLSKIGTAQPVFLMNPDVPLSCPNFPSASITGGFWLELSGSEASMSGTSRYFSCDALVEGRAELTRQ
jgi:hypothetical protein